jgi:integrase
MTEQPVSSVTPFPGTLPGQHRPPKLLDRVRIAIRTRHYSLRTEEAYVGWIKRFIFFHGKRHPAEMGEPEINTFLSGLAVEKRVSASTQNQALCALLFLYRNVLEKPFPTLENLVRAKRPGRLPTVLTRDEIRRILGKMSGTNRIIATLLYGSGMRLLELRVKDVEFGLNRILVRDAKGHQPLWRSRCPEPSRCPLKAHSAWFERV